MFFFVLWFCLAMMDANPYDTGKNIQLGKIYSTVSQYLNVYSSTRTIESKTDYLDFSIRTH